MIRIMGITVGVVGIVVGVLGGLIQEEFSIWPYSSAVWALSYLILWISRGV